MNLFLLRRNYSNLTLIYCNVKFIQTLNETNIEKLMCVRTKIYIIIYNILFTLFMVKISLRSKHVLQTTITLFWEPLSWIWF